MENNSDNVININKYKYPSNTQVIHVKHGLCRVTEMMGDFRRVCFSRKNSYALIVDYDDVHVNTLSPLEIPKELTV